MKVAAAYVPVVHKGHQQFWQKVRPDLFYVVGSSFCSEFPLLERDIRALDPQAIVTICKSLGAAEDVRVLEKDVLLSLTNYEQVVFADDEVMRSIAATYLKDIPITYEKVFLRWDKMAAVTSHPVIADVEVSEQELDKVFMGIARKNAQRSSDWWRQIGSVLVKEGRILLENYNQHHPTENAPYIHGDPRSNFNAGERPDIYTSIHSEAGLIASAAEKGISLKGAAVYVTTFPCPNCALLMIKSGIKEIYYADGYSNLSAQENLKLAGVKLVHVRGV